MTLPRFIQIHTLHNYPAALLNRDDAGLAKRLPYGDAVRTRISSQCLKRHWRMADDLHALANLGVPMAIRSRGFAEKIQVRLLDEGIPEAVAGQVAEALRDALRTDLAKLLKEKDKAAKKGKRKSQDVEEDGEVEPDTGADASQKQAILLGASEFSYLSDLSLEVARTAADSAGARRSMLLRLKAEQANLIAMTMGCGLESALFGRMVTSDLLSARDAAVYVAHAFTVHSAQVENDYFTVVDDLLRDAGEQGSAGIFDTELASGLYYGYVVIDVPQLIANLEGEAARRWAELGADKRELAGRVVESLLHLIATVSPGAKRGSTAPFEWAKFMLVEAGDWQPRSLSGAFQNALPSTTPQLRQSAVRRLADEIAAMDEAYGASQARRYLAVDPVEIPGAKRESLADLGAWVRSSIGAASAVEA